MIRFLRHRAALAANNDRGGISLFVLITAVAVILAAGLVADGGRKLRAASAASAVAEEAARAGAGQVDADQLRQTGQWRISGEDAVAAADAYLRNSGHQGSASVVNNGQTVRVTVTIIKPTLILQSIGIGEVSATRTAEADLVHGVNGEGQ
jgi:putative Flp pilus-assembly TadE/G-like protein